MMDHSARLSTRTEPQIDYAMAYLEAHELSSPSLRYVYILWILVAGFSVILGLEYMLGLSQRTFIGVVWSKWATMQYIPRHVHRITFVALQMRRVVFAVVLLLPLLLLTFLGPDYIAPSVSLFGTDDAMPSTPDEACMARRDVQWGLGLYPRILTRKPTYTLPYHTMWTVGSRFGDFCNALTPLIILFALKQAPCALFSLPVFGQMSSNALQFLHKWGGYLLWVYALIHTLLWIGQVASDAHVQPGLWTHLLSVPRFRWAIVAFIFLTVLVILSIPPIRRYYYEFFYVTHIVCIIGFMVATWAHHPQLGWWMLAGFLVWGMERVWRAVRTLHFNYSERPKELRESMRVYQRSFTTKATPNGPITVPAKRDALDDNDAIVSMYMAATSTTSLASTMTPSLRSVVADELQQQLFPGFAFVQPLAGQMMRVVLRTAKPMTWSPGQWVYVGFPELSWIQTHPFTIACSYVDEFERLNRSLDDAEAHRDAHLLVLLIRTREGLTHRLWEFVQQRCRANLAHSAGSREKDAVFPLIQGTAIRTLVQGVYMRTIVDGPFGGSSRIDWNAYSSAMIVCGGSGVSLGLAVLEHLCAKIALVRAGQPVLDLWGRSFAMQRVRFVWIMRDYAHLQWAASALRRCLEILPPESLTIEMYATRVHYAMQNTSADDTSEPMHVAPEKALHEMGLRETDLTQFEEGEDRPLNAVEQSMNEHIRVKGQLRRERTRKNRLKLGKRSRLTPVPFTQQHADWQADRSLHTQENAPQANESTTSFVDMSDALPEHTLLGDAYPLKQFGTKPSTPGTETPPFVSSPLRPATPISRSMSPQPASASRTDVSSYANLDLHELNDFTVLSELTFPGYPDLSRIVHEEVAQAKGRSIVVGCGPAGLMALLRTSVSNHVSLRKVWHGDTSGHVNLFTESYEI